MNQRRASSELMVAIAGGSGATERALEEARRISDSTYRARALAKLAEHVPARSLAALFEAAQGLPPTDRAEALEPLLERLTGARLENAATAVLAVDDDDLPIRARRVARAGLPKLAISAALAIRKDRERRFRALEMLADFLNRSELTEVFAEAASEAPHGYREYLYLNSNITWKLVVKLAPLVAQLPPEISAMCWRRTLRDWSFSERGDLANMLGALMPIQAALRGKPSSRAMLDSLAQVRRWWQ
jgi:hypothetical protein